MKLLSPRPTCLSFHSFWKQRLKFFVVSNLWAYPPIPTSYTLPCRAAHGITDCLIRVTDQNWPSLFWWIAIPWGSHPCLPWHHLWEGGEGCFPIFADRKIEVGQRACLKPGERWFCITSEHCSFCSDPLQWGLVPTAGWVVLSFHCVGYLIFHSCFFPMKDKEVIFLGYFLFLAAMLINIFCICNTQLQMSIYFCLLQSL